MNYFEALRVFSINNGNDINEARVKKIYRGLVKRYHPDVCGNDIKYKQIQDAYEQLKLVIAEAEMEQAAKEEEHRSFAISLDDLLSLFNGKEITVDGQILHKSDVNVYKIYIKIEVSVIVNGVESIYKFIKPRNIKDNYDMDITLYDVDTDKPLDINIKILNKSIRRIMEYPKMNFRFNMDYIAQLNVAIHRVKIDDMEHE